jgi:Zn-dependent M16 (insulinase) family peptidase
MHKYLWPRLRTARSAYRVRCSFDDDHTLPVFLVSQCPQQTALDALRLFSNVFAYGEKLQLSADQLQAAKRGLLGKLDALRIEDPVGMAESTFDDMLRQIPPEQWAQLRHAVTTATLDDVRSVSARLQADLPTTAKVLVVGER